MEYSSTKSIANPPSFSSVTAVLALSMEKKISSSGQGGDRPPPPKYGPVFGPHTASLAVIYRAKLWASITAPSKIINDALHTP
jgi:hypothetical protein